MARFKKGTLPKPKVIPATDSTAEAQSDVNTAKPVAQADASNSAETPAIEQHQRKTDQNLSFWRNLGYYDTHPNHNKSRIVRDDKNSLSRKRRDNGKVKEKYNLYVNSSMKRVLLLQYPNRERNQVYHDAVNQKPLEVRIKPKSGVVEVDVPMATDEFFDVEKGIDFGSALKNSQSVLRGGSYGLSGGLGIGPNRAIGNDEDAVTDGPLRERLLDNFEDSNNKGYVMNKITLAGRIVPFQDGGPMYMIATFSGTKCTWTRLDAIVQLRPQLNHIDALNELQKSSARSGRNPENKVKEDRAEDVNMVIKTTDDNENIDMYGGMNVTAKLLRAMRDEPWQRLQWIDQDDDDSYGAFQETLVYQKSDDATQLITEMTNEQYLNAISCPRNDPISQGKKVMQSLGDEDGSSATEEGASDEGNTDGGAVDPDADDSDVSEGGRAYESLPEDISQPDGIMERDMERICRIICMEPHHKRDQFEHLLRGTKGNRPKFTFLNSDDRFHPYFRWRLRCNNRGKGIGPEFDYGKGV